MFWASIVQKLLQKLLIVQSKNSSKFSGSELHISSNVLFNENQNFFENLLGQSWFRRNLSLGPLNRGIFNAELNRHKRQFYTAFKFDIEPKISKTEYQQMLILYNKLMNFNSLFKPVFT